MTFRIYSVLQKYHYTEYDILVLRMMCIQFLEANVDLAVFFDIAH